MEENSLKPWIDRARSDGMLDEQALVRIQAELWELLGRKADVFAPGDSGIRLENARELYRSVLYTISLALSAHAGDEARALASRPMAHLYQEGQRLLLDGISRGRVLYARAIDTMLSFDNRAYRDTLAGIGGFFDAYQGDLYAHEIPCSIDYPLALPVRSQEGITYICQYLAALIAENMVAGAFPAGTAARLYASLCPNPREQIINLFEPVAVNALGRALLGRSVLPLSMDADERALLVARLSCRSRADLQDRLRQAAIRVSDELEISDAAARERLLAAGNLLAGRLSRLLPDGSLAGVFLSFS